MYTVNVPLGWRTRAYLFWRGGEGLVQWTV